MIKPLVSELILLALLMVSLTLGQAFGYQATDPIDVSSKPWGVEPLIYRPDANRTEANRRRAFEELGAASCAASACHGGPSAGVSSVTANRGSEYPLWIESDPHAKSWQTLNSPKSIEILKRLNILVDGRVIHKAAYQNCLACHNTSVSLASDGVSPLLAEGVGCEACHGPSQGYRDSHYQGTDIVRIAVEQLGLVNTKSEFIQAKACSLCHVGGPDRDMNHDIIAAGHPALYFDYATYIKAYPKHWRDDSSSRSSSKQLQWLAGQVAKADSELELLASRVSKSQPNSVWPEFASQQCTSCHQRIGGLNNSRDEADLSTGPKSGSGKASIRMWNLDGLLAADEALDLDRAVTDELFDALHRVIPKYNANGDEVDSLLKAIHKKRNQMLAAMPKPTTNASVEALVGWTPNAQRNWAKRKWNALGDSPNWEQAALAYIATISVLPENVDPRALERMRGRLVFPESMQSPTFKIQRRSADPADPLQLEHWSEDLAEILEMLGHE